MPTNPYVAQWLVRSLARLSATFAIVQGLGIIVAGRDRWQGEAFKSALSVPGAPESWGFFLALGGAVALLGSLTRRRPLVITGLYLCAAWCLFFALSFILVSLRSGTASTTGIGTYVYIGALFVVLAEGHRKR